MYDVGILLPYPVAVYISPRFCHQRGVSLTSVSTVNLGPFGSCVNGPPKCKNASVFIINVFVVCWAKDMATIQDTIINSTNAPKLGYE